MLTAYLMTQSPHVITAAVDGQAEGPPLQGGLGSFRGSMFNPRPKKRARMVNQNQLDEKLAAVGDSLMIQMSSPKLLLPPGKPPL